MKEAKCWFLKFCRFKVAHDVCKYFEWESYRLVLWLNQRVSPCNFIKFKMCNRFTHKTFQ